jgi:hypothetical protein
VFVTILARTDRWGDYPTWAGAIGTLLLVASAIYAAIYAARLYGIETKRDQVARDREMQSQATLISGWVKPEPIEDLSLDRMERWNGDGLFFTSVTAVIHNRSTLPIYNVVILWRLLTPSSDVDAIDYVEESLRTAGRDVIPPETPESFVLPKDLLAYLTSPPIMGWASQGFQESLDESKYAARHFRILFSFTDSTGIRWERNQVGVLKRKPSVDSAD